VYAGTHGGAGWFTNQHVLTTLFERLRPQAMYYNNNDRRLKRGDIHVGSVELVDQEIIIFCKPGIFDGTTRSNAVCMYYAMGKKMNIG